MRITLGFAAGLVVRSAIKACPPVEADFPTMKTLQTTTVERSVCANLPPTHQAFVIFKEIFRAWPPRARPVTKIGGFSLTRERSIGGKAQVLCRLATLR